MIVLTPTVVIGVLTITAGAAWLTASGWALVVGGLILLALHLLPAN